MAATSGSVDRYLLVSVDGHAGADLLDYRPYLQQSWHDEFDAWAAAYVNPWGDLVDPDADRNWNSDRRLHELHADGVVAEVLFPNTIPPFFPSGSLLAPAPKDRAEYEHRWAGVQAHNRWLAEFVAEAPKQRVGLVQVLLNDVNAAVREIRWGVEHGLNGVMLPGVPPDRPDMAPLWSEVYEPVWQTCAELDVTINHHAGAGVPAYGMDARSRAIMLVEIPIWSHRGLWHVIFAGVFERYPSLRWVMTEQGTGWVPRTLDSLDWFYHRMCFDGAPEQMFGGEAAAELSMLPSEYFRRNCWIGASFLRPLECTLREEIGVDRIMWGADYPHSEGTPPHTREALRATFSDVPVEQCRAMLGLTAAEVYRLDLDHLNELAARYGPTVDEVRVPLEAFPPGSPCGTFDEHPVIRAW